MLINTIEKLLIKVSSLTEQYDKIASISGENFNIFKVMKVHGAEVRTHSAIIGEFLNPNGTHGQKDLFLKLFVKQCGIEDFDTKSANLEIEKHTGQINEDYTEGGRLDILLTDRNKKRIIIENKIHAGDQENQLLRYYNFDKEAHLFYLTLNGKEPSDFTTAGAIPLDKFKLISYSSDIIQWLEKCKKEAVSLPIIRESIGQYSNLLRTLTNQTTMDQLKEELGKLLLIHPEYIDAIEKSHDSLNSILIETEAKFKATLIESGYPSTYLLADNSILEIICTEDDDDGIYFGYSYFQEGNPANESERGLELADLLKHVEGEHTIIRNPSHIGWFNPFHESSPINKRFKNLDKKEIIKMYLDESYLRNFVEMIVYQEKKIRTKFFQRDPLLEEIINKTVIALS